VALQVGAAAAQLGGTVWRAPLVNLGPEIASYADTMAVLDGLDLVVTVDTSVAHVAGAKHHHPPRVHVIGLEQKRHRAAAGHAHVAFEVPLHQRAGLRHGIGKQRPGRRDRLLLDPAAADRAEPQPLRIEQVEIGHKAALAGLMRQYRDVPMSLADACLVRMSELNTDCEVMTTDRDFLVYRRLNRRVIPLIAPWQT
jgi:hypothetical protein